MVDNDLSLIDDFESDKPELYAFSQSEVVSVSLLFELYGRPHEKIIVWRYRSSTYKTRFLLNTEGIIARRNLLELETQLIARILISANNAKNLY